MLLSVGVASELYESPLLDSPHLYTVLLLILDRRPVAIIPMPAHWIIEELDIVKDILPSARSGLVDRALEAFPFE